MAIRGPEQQREKMGRIVRDDPIYKRMLLARASRVPTRSPRTAGGRPASTSRQTVLKVIAYTKSATAVVNMVNYIARDRAEDRAAGTVRPVLRDENGNVVTPDAARRRLSDEWGIVPDSQNLSKAARAADPAARREMPVEERLYKRQAAHITFSVQIKNDRERKAVEGAMLRGISEMFADDVRDKKTPKGNDDHSPDPSRQFGAGKAARASGRQDFAERESTAGDRGHAVSLESISDTPAPIVSGGRAIWTMHDDHGAAGRIHAHIILGMKRRNGRQVRIGKRELTMMRGYLTELLHDAGLDVEATAREDRAELREKIAMGEERLRPNRRRDSGRGNREAMAGMAPAWSASFGADYAARVIGDAKKKVQQNLDIIVKVEPPAKQRPKPPKPSAIDTVDSLFTATFSDPVEARQSWEALRAETKRDKPALASWMLINRPDYFGGIKKPIPEKAKPRLQQMLRSAPPAEAGDTSPVQGAARVRQIAVDSRRMSEMAHDAGETLRSLNFLANSVEDPALAKSIRKEMALFAQLAQQTLTTGMALVQANAPASSSGGRLAPQRDQVERRSGDAGGTGKKKDERER